MSDLSLECTCPCGHRTVVSEFAVGMTSSCPKCGEALTVSDDNTVPAKTPLALESSNGVLIDGCQRCGKVFRGEWDRHDTRAGAFCNICANQGYGQASELVREAEAAAQTAEAEPELVDDDEAFEAGERWWLDPGSLRFKTALMALAFGVMTLGITFVLMDEPVSSHLADRTAPLSMTTNQGSVELSPFLVGLSWGLRVVFLYLLFIINLYFVWYFTENFANDAFLKNVLVMAIIAVPFTLLSLEPVALHDVGTFSSLIRYAVLYFLIKKYCGLTFWEYACCLGLVLPSELISRFVSRLVFAHFV